MIQIEACTCPMPSDILIPTVGSCLIDRARHVIVYPLWTDSSFATITYHFHPLSVQVRART